MDPGPLTQLRMQSTKCKYDGKVLQGVRRGSKMSTNCVAGSAEDANSAYFVSWEDSNIIDLFWILDAFTSMRTNAKAFCAP